MKRELVACIESKRDRRTSRHLDKEALTHIEEDLGDEDVGVEGDEVVSDSEVVEEGGVVQRR